MFTLGFRSVSLALLVTAGCAREQPAAKPAPAQAVDLRATPDPSIQFTEVKLGVGEKVRPGVMVFLLMRTRAPDGGLVWETDRDAGTFNFIVGRRGPDRVLDEVVRGMAVRGIRRVPVPARMAEGRPPGDMLEVELDGIEYIVDPAAP